MTEVWRNDGGGSFSQASTAPTGVRSSSVAWGDYDNDGDLDILLAGSDDSAHITEVWRNDGGGSFSQASSAPTGVSYSSVAWGDYDNDGDLDILLTGFDGSYTPVTEVWRNDDCLSDLSYVYLPLVLGNYAPAPDLVVERVVATTEGVQVVIANQGYAAVTDGFWVDVYINPSPAPTSANELWRDLASHGLVWGVTVEMQPGEVLTLTVGGDYYAAAYSEVSWPLAEGTLVYAQVDSWKAQSTVGAVLENHEVTGGPYNNVSDPTAVTSGGGAGVAIENGSPIPESLPGRP